MSLVEAGGHLIRVLDQPGAGLPVMFAADAPVVLEHYAPRLGRLAPKRRALAIELPGFGFSRPAPAYRFTLDEQVAALAALLDALEIERLTLAFSCANALVALAFAHRHPSRVDKLVLAQVPSAEELVRWLGRIDLRILGRGVLATPLLGQALMWSAPSWIADRWFRLALPHDGRDFTHTSRRVYSAGGGFCLAALIQSLHDPRTSDVGASPVPTTIVWGDADRTHHKTIKSSSRAWHPDAKLIHWPTTGHCPDLERPDDFAKLL